MGNKVVTVHFCGHHNVLDFPLRAYSVRRPKDNLDEVKVLRANGPAEKLPMCFMRRVKKCHKNHGQWGSLSVKP